MPELPEVETVVRSLRPAVVGCVIGHVRLGRADMVRPPLPDLAERLAGRTLCSIDRRAKYIVFTLDDGNRWYIHLGMTGRLTLAAPSTSPRPHTHLVLGLRSPHPQSLELRLSDPRRFGHIRWLGPRDPVHAMIGPEPLEITSAELARRLAKTRRAIKTALLDQRLLAGLGNIYADEALFAARIDPRIGARDLSAAQVRRLCSAVKSILRRAIRHGGSTFRDYADANGAAGQFQRQHRVYGREGEPCPRCGTAITRVVLGGRSTHFCAECVGPRGSTAANS